MVSCSSTRPRSQKPLDASLFGKVGEAGQVTISLRCHVPNQTRPSCPYNEAPTKTLTVKLAQFCILLKWTVWLEENNVHHLTSSSQI